MTFNRKTSCNAQTPVAYERLKLKIRGGGKFGVCAHYWNLLTFPHSPALILLFHQIGDLGLAVSSNVSRRVTAHVAGTRSHIPPEASKSTAIEPDEAWDIYT